MSKVLIIGGGAAGMFASIFAAKNGNEVHVFEKNEKLGKKLFITGKGRCNVTNNCSVPILSVVFPPLLPHRASVISRLPEPEGPTSASTAGAVIFSGFEVEAFMI